MKRTPLARRTPLERSGSLRRTRIKPRSDKAQRDALTLAQAKNEAAARSLGRCEATGIPHDCTGRGEHFHHVLPRSAGGKHTAANLLHACWAGHRAIHDQPTLARRLGYLRSRYGRRVA